MENKPLEFYEWYIFQYNTRVYIINLFIYLSVDLFLFIYLSILSDLLYILCMV